MNYRDFNEDELILRDHLALDRTRLAIERTFLAYVRTAIMVAVSGITLIKLFPTSWSAQISGWVLILLAVLLMFFAAGRFLRLRHSLSMFLRQSGRRQTD